MSTDTANYGFTKDNEDDFYNVNVVNANLDKIDTEMKRIEDAIQPISPTDSVKWIGTVGGTVNALTATHVEITSYSDGLGVSFAANANSTVATTLDINGLGAIPIKKANGMAVTNLKVGGVYTLRYRGSAFILQGEGGEYGNAVANDVRKGKTIGTENGLLTGTLDLTNLKAENIRRGVTIDGIMGGIDKAHGRLDNLNDCGWVMKYSSETSSAMFVVDEGERYELLSKGTVHTITKFNAAGVAIQTAQCSFAQEAYYRDIPKFGEIQLSRQFYYCNAYNWDTGVLIHSLYLGNFGQPYVTIPTTVPGHPRMLLGYTDGQSSSVGVWSSSLVWLAGISWLENISGYGFVRAMAPNVTIVHGKGASCLLYTGGADWHTIRATYFSTHADAYYVLSPALAALSTLGRKV
jgi:hypothetical protein